MKSLSYSAQHSVNAKHDSQPPPVFHNQKTVAFGFGSTDWNEREAIPVNAEMIERYKAEWKRNGFANDETRSPHGVGDNINDCSYQPAPENTMWIAFLSSLVEDAQGLTKDSQKRCASGHLHNNQTCAKLYMLTPDFRELCDNLGVDVSRFIELAEETTVTQRQFANGHNLGTTTNAGKRYRVRG